MATPLIQNLETLAQALSVVQTVGANPGEFGFQIVAPGRGPLSVLEEISSTQIDDGKLSLLWRTKDVRFVKTDISDTAILGGMPISDLLQLNVGNVTTGATAPPGVPGVIGALEGTIPMVIETLTSSTVPVTLDVRWRVRDETGAFDTAAQWSLSQGGPPIAQGTGGDILSPSGQGFALLTLVFALFFVELTQSAPLPVAKRSVQASVRLSASGTSTGWIDLPALEVLLPVVGVPTIAMLFTDVQLKGLALVVVPADSPLDQFTITTALDPLNSALGVVGAAGGAAAFFVNELSPIKTALNSAQRVVFQKVNEIPNLRDVELEPTSISDWNGTVASDEVSSLVFIARPGRQLKCFNDTQFQTGQGLLNVTAGPELLVQMKDLHAKHPPGTPAAGVEIVKEPSGWNWSLARSIDEFGDEISSIQFGWK